ncbi:MAG: hypothetical protein V2I25_04905 [Woeseiaceae bacterium]|jgi:hypothetical protein|nr:hypothetical protein [Woeseiaceae bacterium]
MLKFPFRSGIRWLILGLTGTGIAGMLLGSILVITTQSAEVVRLILIGLVVAGGGFIVTGIAAPAPSMEHYQRTGLYLIPAKNGPIETSSKTGMWMGVLALLLLGALLSGLGIYGLAKTRTVTSTDAPVAASTLDARSRNDSVST